MVVVAAADDDDNDDANDAVDAVDGVGADVNTVLCFQFRTGDLYEGSLFFRRLHLVCDALLLFSSRVSCRCILASRFSGT